MIRYIRAICGAAFVAGALALGVIGASAASATSSTTLTLTVPSTLTMTGLAANYSATIPAGTSAAITTGPLSITTNVSTGFDLNVKAVASVFQGATATLPDSADHLAVDACPAGGSCAAGDLNSSSGTDLVRTAGAGSASFSVIHNVSIPATQAGDAYAGTITYTASSN